MPSVLGGKRNTKVFILYLLQNIEIPVTFITLNDMIMETDYVMYLDFAECFYELLDNSLIVAVGEENGQETYTVSPQGKHVAQQLHTDLLPVVLDESLKCALRYLDFKKRGIRTECSVRANPDGSAEFICGMQEQGRSICTATIHCDCLARAQQMERNFRERPEAVYKGMWALLSGNVNCLFS